MVSTSPEEQAAAAAAAEGALNTSVDTTATPSPSSPPPGRDAGKPRGSVADRVAWLQNAFAKDAANNSPSSKRDLVGLESSTSVSDRKRWMEEEAFRKHLEDRGVDTAGTSHASLVEERKRWLDEQAEKNRLENEKNQVKATGSPRSAARTISTSSSTGAAEETTRTDAGDTKTEDVAVSRDGDSGADGKVETEDAQDAMEEPETEAAHVHVDADEISDQEETATTNRNSEANAEEDKTESEPPEPPLAEEETEIPPAKDDGKDGENAEASTSVVSPPPRPSSQDPPIKTTASTMMRATETSGKGAAAMPCLFSSPVFAQQRDQMEFFLPAACSCQKCRAELAADGAAAAERRADPTALKTILRPWQVEFLESEGITTAQALVNVEKDAESRHALCKNMKRWRKKKEAPAKTISCLMACRIWAKTSEEALKNASAK